ncbi:MAG TPA: ABC transporter permease [Acetobacteraceae bacterium]
MTLALSPAAPGEASLDLAAGQTGADRTALALRDLREAAGLWRLCWTLAWLDIRLRYRGSVLGPFWLTLSTAVMVGALGFVYSTLFGMNLADYMAFLALSLVLWNFLGTLVGDACMGFTSAETTIRSMRMPYTLYAARIVVRNILILAHNVVVIVAVDLILWFWPGQAALLALPGLALWLLDSMAISVLLGALCARFRDIPPIVANIMQMAFFVSAVIWKPSQLHENEWMLAYNPFYTLLEVVRGPLLGEVPSTSVYVSALAFSAALCVLSWVLFVRVRGRIAFWV